MLESALNYTVAMPERPRFYTYTPLPAGARMRNTRGDRRTLPIRDARELDPPPDLDGAGFQLVRHETAVSLYDADAVRACYYPEVESRVREATGAARVVAFDHNVRGPTDTSFEGVQSPVRFVHNDYTEVSGPQRVRDLLPEEAEVLLRSRFAVVNVWKPIRGPIVEAPLAFCDARSMQPSDFMPTDLVYRDRTGEVYSVTFNPQHRWYYYSKMQADELLLLKCFDSDRARARFTAHTAFDDPNTPLDARPRESIEVRTLAFFAPKTAA